MWWVLFSVLALVAGVMLFSQLQEELPDELAFLKTKPGAGSRSGTAENGPTAVLGFVGDKATAWQLRRGAEHLELARDFYTPIRSDQRIYDAPELVFTCYQDRLYTRLEPRLRSKPDAPAGDTLVSINGHSAQPWVRSDSLALYAPNANQVLQQALRSPELTAALSFAEAPPQTLALKTAGLAQALATFPVACRGTPTAVAAAGQPAK